MGEGRGIYMDAVIDFGQVSLDVPAKLFHFLGLEPLKLLDIHSRRGGKIHKNVV